MNTTELRNSLIEETDPELLREIERTLAFERAAGVIESQCIVNEEENLDSWYDLGSADLDLSQEIAYLLSRGLLIRHGTEPRWVMIRDEDEAQPTQAVDPAALEATR